MTDSLMLLLQIGVHKIITIMYIMQLFVSANLKLSQTDVAAFEIMPKSRSHKYAPSNKYVIIIRPGTGSIQQLRLDNLKS